MDPLKIIVGVLVRYGIVIICALLAKVGLSDTEKSALLNPEVIAAITVGILAIGASLYSRLNSKLKQKLALEMPKGTSQSELKEAAKEQPLSSVLTTDPKKKKG